LLPDDENSSVHGIITSNGLFDGTIQTLHETYYVEPLHRYNLNHSKIHSAIYKSSDVVHPSKNSTLPCASHLLHTTRRQNSAKHREVESRHPMHQGTIVRIIRDYDNDIDSLPRHKREKRWLPNDDDVALSSSVDDDEDDDATPLRNPSLPIDLFVPYYSEAEDTNLEVLLNKIKNGTEKTRGILISSYDDETDDEIPSRPNSKNHIEVRTKVNVQNDVVGKKPVGYTIVSSLTGNISDSALRHVNKRATIDPKKTTCMLYLQADHMFFQKFGSEEACIEVMTRHVQRVNAIYRVTGEKFVLENLNTSLYSCLFDCRFQSRW
jgi:disintegrin and metalloproteinase domain-containing protein 10